MESEGAKVTVQTQPEHYAAEVATKKDEKPLDFAHRRRRFNWQNPLRERAGSE
ncbi:hypothetical protein SAMN06296386_11217 [Lachnospiraceae bacterium]|nr:hypothetical protein SAMN06296386_11217 [Lachnospiraceae bacterium]